MSQTNTLAPCPFCGGVPHLKPSTRGDYTSIVCPIESVCGGPIAVVIPNDQIEEGIAAWNCRAPTPVSAMALTDEAYDLIDRYLRNNLDDTDYAEYSTALEAVRVAPAPASQPVAAPAGMQPYAQHAIWHEDNCTGYDAARLDIASLRAQESAIGAAPQPAAQALDAGQWTQEDLREFCAIGRATNRAAGDLPDFARIRIDLENGGGTVYWLDNKSGQWRYIDSGDLFSTHIDAATDAAIAAQQGCANG